MFSCFVLLFIRGIIIIIIIIMIITGLLTNALFFCLFLFSGLAVREMEDERSGEDEFFSPECAKMEAWLDEHPEFSREYFIR